MTKKKSAPLTDEEKLENISQVIAQDQRLSEYFVATITSKVEADIEQKNFYRGQYIRAGAMIAILALGPAIWFSIQNVINTSVGETLEKKSESFIGEIKKDLTGTIDERISAIRDSMNMQLMYSEFSNEALAIGLRDRVSDEEAEKILILLSEIAPRHELTSRREFPVLLEAIMKAFIANDLDKQMRRIEETFHKQIDSNDSMVNLLCNHYGLKLISNVLPPSRWGKEEMEKFTYYQRIALSNNAHSIVIPLQILIELRKSGKKESTIISRYFSQIQELPISDQALVLYNLIKYSNPDHWRLVSVRTSDIISQTTGELFNLYQRELEKLISDPALRGELLRIEERKGQQSNPKMVESIGSMVSALTLFTEKRLPGEYADDIQETIHTIIEPAVNDPIVINAIRLQNKKYATISEGEIRRLDRTWRSRASQKPYNELINSVLNKPLSQYLRDVKTRSFKLFTEMIIMDNHGLNVGISDVTSDFWQGDENKWQKTFKVGKGAQYISEIEFDTSIHIWQLQVSLALTDPETNQVIGAATVGINPGKL